MHWDELLQDEQEGCRPKVRNKLHFSSRLWRTTCYEYLKLGMLDLKLLVKDSPECTDSPKLGCHSLRLGLTSSIIEHSLAYTHSQDLCYDLSNSCFLGFTC